MKTLVIAEENKEGGRLAVWVTALLIIFTIANLINLGITPHVLWPVNSECWFAISSEIWFDVGEEKDEGNGENFLTTITLHNHLFIPPH